MTLKDWWEKIGGNTPEAKKERVPLLLFTLAIIFIVCALFSQATLTGMEKVAGKSLEIALGNFRAIFGLLAFASVFLAGYLLDK